MGCVETGDGTCVFWVYTYSSMRMRHLDALCSQLNRNEGAHRCIETQFASTALSLCDFAIGPLVVSHQDKPHESFFAGHTKPDIGILE